MWNDIKEHWRGYLIILLLIVFILLQIFPPNKKDDSSSKPAETYSVSADVNKQTPQSDNRSSKPTEKYHWDPNNVYWVPKGTVYHSTSSCSYLDRSQRIYHGTVSEARMNGKSRGCSRCANGH